MIPLGLTVLAADVMTAVSVGTFDWWEGADAEMFDSMGSRGR
jgi:hypothetical protein